ncbi:hypothetical protein BDW22DRAFT_1211507 [Trametopsis cervina]|nr:hypothetical protein BDW22DRAFT_1211507 [Trametopsis cervina]
MSAPPLTPIAEMKAAGIDPGNTIGALLIGGLVSAILYGITSTQTVVYYQRAPNDWWLVKLTVPLLWCLDTLDMCLIFHILYWYLITNYGDPTSLSDPTWSIIVRQDYVLMESPTNHPASKLHVLVTSVTQTVVRGMFATRIWRLSNGSWLPVAIICAVSLTDLVTCLIITIKAFHITFAELKKLDALVYLEFAAGFLGDFLVAVTLCYILHKSRTGFGRTENIINWLMTYVINTGLFTALTSSVSLILFASKPNDFIYVAVYFQLSKLYVNAYVAMLNARDRMRERSSSPLNLSTFELSHTRTGPTIPTMTHGVRTYSKNSRGGMSVFVDTEVDTTSERAGRSLDDDMDSPSRHKKIDMSRTI